MREEEIIAFFESGELEAYLMGSLAPKEEERIEALIQSEPRIKEHFESLEADLELISGKFKQTPPPHLKASLFEEIENQEKPVQEPKVVPIQPKGSTLNIAAALVIFILGSFLAWTMYQSNQLENRLAKMESEARDQAERILDLEGKQTDLLAQNAFLSNPETKKVKLKDSAETLSVTAYWNNQEEVALIHSAALPELPADKCYQIWADVEGEMLSVGILEESDEPLPVQFYAEATSLNITVEKAGGSDHATVANLVTNVFL